MEKEKITQICLVIDKWMKDNIELFGKLPFKSFRSWIRVRHFSTSLGRFPGLGNIQF